MMNLSTRATITLAAFFCGRTLLAQSAIAVPVDMSVPGAPTATTTAYTMSISSSVSDADSLPDAPLPSYEDRNSNGTLSHRAVTGSAQNGPFPDAHHRLGNYLAGALGPGAFIAAGISAGVDQSHSLKVGYPADGYPGTGNHPGHGAVPEWGEGFDGYAKRYASRYGMSLVSTTTRYGLGELLHEDVSYHQCECSGALRRTTHALEQSFVAHTASGRAVVSLPALVSPFVGAEVGVAGWYPARYNVSDALRTSTNLYVSAPVQNLVNEFLRR